MTPKRKSCQTSESTATATHNAARRRRMGGANGRKPRDRRIAVTAGAITRASAATIVNGFARSAPATSKWPSRTAAVVVPQIGHGIPVNARNGHSVAGRPGSTTCAAASAAAAARTARSRLAGQPDCPRAAVGGIDSCTHCVAAIGVPHVVAPCACLCCSCARAFLPALIRSNDPGPAQPGQASATPRRSCVFTASRRPAASMGSWLTR